MLHHVRPYGHGAFVPNRLLEVTPQFLDAALARATSLGFQFASLDQVVAHVRARGDGPPQLAVTFDDGYVDNLEHALPVLRRHGVPATVFVTPGFADRTSTLWWLDLEHAIAASPEVVVDLGTGEERLPCAGDAQRSAAFERIYWSLRSGPEARLRSTIALLAARAGIDTQATVARLCLDWAGLARLAADPLVSIGAHTMTHPMLAKHDAAVVRSEMAQSRDVIVERLGVPVRHLAYPVGDPGSAGSREFAMAAEL
ncbi:MAG: polysaccharide deacetylase family protein, partial [Alsobacter sp.]